jgi:signal transduction histidine kinase
MAELEHMSYSMVHDMRAPLRAMQGFAGLIEYECSDCLRPPALDYLHRIGESSNRLDRLITDALNYNKVVCENLPITPVDLGQLLRSMVRTYPHLHPSIADITIELTNVMVLGNESLLTQCFGNLLDNSVKFVARDVRPRVRIWSEAVKSPESAAANSEVKNQKSEIENPVARIWIEDNGIGIPGTAREKIFQMFQRMHGESEYPGTGIGLAIVRKAVERMNGHISFDSEPGKGTRFCVELPGTDRKAPPESPSTLVLRA